MACSTGFTTPDYLNKDFMRQTLEYGLRLVNLEIVDIRLRNLTVGGENYCSNIYGVSIRYKTEAGKESEKYLIIKSMPMDKQILLGRLSIYCKETIFYLDIMPKLETLMCCSNETWILGAKHYYSTTTPIQTIVVEDLCRQGFEEQSRQIGLDKMHASAVMRKLGEYHALTMCLIEKQPDNIKGSFQFGLINKEAVESEAFKSLFGSQLLKLTTLITDYPGFDKISKKLLRYYDNLRERVLNAVYPLKGTINVLNHGDLWVNNLLFRSVENQNIPEVRFIDYQFCFYGSLGFDINYFLITSVQLDVLKQHKEELITIYFKALISTLEILPYEHKLPTFDQILKEVHEREGYGFFVAFAFFPLMSMLGLDSQDNSLQKLQVEEFARQKIELMFKSNPRTMDTLRYLLKYYDDLGIFD
ncbi:uncharacterized protein LOC119671036 [Teleopsis dalmanni]|uniref:uncharacterized protein LOC119671036 n=1 Tax=Teleopsis dalmanni TaxID=139649 RepID=UPI0018CE4293|nr:uncharacterized protein LOC119671036 [Teleopsis dalmanni]